MSHCWEFCFLPHPARTHRLAWAFVLVRCMPALGQHRFALMVITATIRTPALPTATTVLVTSQAASSSAPVPGITAVSTAGPVTVMASGRATATARATATEALPFTVTSVAVITVVQRFAAAGGSTVVVAYTAAVTVNSFRGCRSSASDTLLPASQ